MESSSKT